MKYSEIINGLDYQQLKNNDRQYLKDMFLAYANFEIKNGNTSASICDLYNKCFQLNVNGFIDYVEGKEGKLPKKYVTGTFEYFSN